MTSSGKSQDIPARPNVKVAQGSIVCIEAEYTGDITVGARTVVHPKARILAEAGPIVIGEGNLIEEQALIINKLPEGVSIEDSQPQTLVIGNNNVFEVGAVCEALVVGDYNVFEAKCHVGREVKIGRGCVIGSLCSVNTTETLPDNIVIYGDQHSRRIQMEKPAPQGLQLDFLTKILPNYHHLIKPKKKPLPT